MRISLSNVSKVFGRETVFRERSHVFESGSRTAILGPNGSGKSTLLQVAAGAMMPTSGLVVHELIGSVIAEENVYRHISIAAPYMAVYEDLSLHEVIANHRRLKPLHADIAVEELAHIAMLEKHLDKPVRNFSSGMKQRLKLALAILSDTPLLLLDEPASNLDTQGIVWFRELLLKHIDRRTLIVASNRQGEETFACASSLDMASWK